MVVSGENFEAQLCGFTFLILIFDGGETTFNLKWETKTKKQLFLK